MSADAVISHPATNDAATCICAGISDDMPAFGGGYLGLG
jgi:hypothetical protein